MDSVSISLFYDDYEKTYGDGLYPCIFKEKHFLEHAFTFDYDKERNIWRQNKCDAPIYGFDGQNGELVITALNQTAYKTAIVILNIWNKQIHPKQ